MNTEQISSITTIFIKRRGFLKCSHYNGSHSKHKLSSPACISRNKFTSLANKLADLWFRLVSLQL